MDNQIKTEILLACLPHFPPTLSAKSDSQWQASPAHSPNIWPFPQIISPAGWVDLSLLRSGIGEYCIE